MENEVLKAIRERRSIRRYTPQPPTDAELAQILEAAAFAPSGSNSQTWLFTAVCGEENLLTLNEAVRAAFARLTVTENDYPARKNAKAGAANPAYNFYYHAPVLVIASNVAGYGNAMADCACALQNAMLAAHSLGLGSCWINQLHWLDGDEGLRAHLETMGIPLSHTICGAVAIGHIDGARPNPPARKEGTIRIVR